MIKRVRFFFQRIWERIYLKLLKKKRNSNRFADINETKEHISENSHDIAIENRWMIWFMNINISFCYRHSMLKNIKLNDFSQ